MSNDEIRSVIEAALQPGRFFVAEACRLRIEHQPEEETAWETFRGHLLDASRTRERRTFEAWNVFLLSLSEAASVRDADSADWPPQEPGVYSDWPRPSKTQGVPPRATPLLSVRRDAGTNGLHVTRHLLTYGWEAYEPSPGVIDSRPVQKWMPELVGTIDLACSRRAKSAGGPRHHSGQNREYPSAAIGRTDVDSLRAELSTLLWLAVVGTSRLPITSLESPLPAFSLGHLMYLPGEAAGMEPCREPEGLIDRALSHSAPASEKPPMPSAVIQENGSTSVQRAKLLETALRASPPEKVAGLAERVRHRCRSDGIPGRDLSVLFRTLFNNVALSPFTGFVDNLLSLLHRLGEETNGLPGFGPGWVIDVFGSMLRQLSRHLTAFDLETFHNRGANYPDALTLDALLKAYFGLIDRHREEFEPTDDDGEFMQRRKQRRRRAVRQGWLLRKHYERLPVPDAPTSPGDNLRVLPEPFGRVPEEQIVNPKMRNRRLYADDPINEHVTENGRDILRQSVADLDDPDELRELGMALYLDRPLGVFKEPGEVDRTPLLSYQAFSRQMARQRLNQLRRLEVIEDDEQFQSRLRQLDELSVRGYPVERFPPAERPGVVALEDAHKAAADLLFLRTTRRSLEEFLDQYDLASLKGRGPEVVEWLFSGEPVLLIRTTGVPSPLGRGPIGNRLPTPPADSSPASPLQGGEGVDEGCSYSPGLRLTAYDEMMQPRLEFGVEQNAPLRYVESFGQEHLPHGLRVTAVWHRDEQTGQWTAQHLDSDDILLPPRM